MPSAQFTLSGTDWTIQDQSGTQVIGDFQFAFLQFPVGMEPWRCTSIYQMQPNVVDYSIGYSTTTHNFASTQVFTTSFDTPLYLWMNANINGSWSQAGMYQITDILNLNNTAVTNIDLNQSNIIDIMGMHNGLTFTTTDYTTWNGMTAIPEPSYAPMAGFMLVGVLIAKKFKKK